MNMSKKKPNEYEGAGKSGANLSNHIRLIIGRKRKKLLQQWFLIVTVFCPTK